MISKEKLLEEIKKHKHLDGGWVRVLDLETYNIVSKIEGRNFGEKLYKYITGDNGECKVCGNPCYFRSFSEGYKNHFCSSKCFLHSRGITSPFALPEVRAKVRQRRVEGAYENAQKARKKTMILKYGEDYKHTVGEKSKQTKLKKYGTLKLGIEKRKATCISKYGPGGRSEKQQKSVKKVASTFGFGSGRYKQWLQDQGVENISQLPKVKNAKRLKRQQMDFQTLVQISKKRGLEPLFSLEDFTGYENKAYPFRCTVCNRTFKYDRVQSDYIRCPHCYPKRDYTSYAQQEITKYLESLGVFVKTNVRGILDIGELDIYLPEYKLAIEYDGLYWHSEIGGHKQRTYHLNKTEECANKGIRLIHVFEDEWLLKPEIVKSRLRYALNMETVRFQARKCNIQNISTSEASSFLEQYHIQGYGKSSIKLGAFYEGTLVAVMTFSKLRAALGQRSIEGHYELVRFCTNMSNIPGIFQKLLVEFVKKYRPLQIISYADRRWCRLQGSTVYERSGFKKVSDGTPNYWYIPKGSQKRFHRFTFCKSTLKNKLVDYKEELSEWENMKMAGYDRIWDCGSYKFRLNL